VVKGGGEQSLDLADGERDEAGVGGRDLVRPGRRRCLAIGGVPELCSRDGADGEGGHDEHEMAADRGVEPEALISRLLVSIWPSGTKQ
jgi:hypothetical protein